MEHVESKSICKWLQVLFTNRHKSRVRNLGLLCGAVIYAQSLTMSGLARSLRLPYSFGSCYKRLERFLKSTKWEVTEYFEEVIKWLCSYKVGVVPIIFIVDQTHVPGAEAIFIAVPYRGRAIPVGFRLFRYPKITRSQNLIEETWVKYFLGLLPERVKPVLVFDRGYARTAFIRKLKKWRVPFVMRVKGDVYVRQGDQRFKLKELPWKKGETRWFPNVRYTETWREEVHIAGAYKGKEKWFLVVDPSLEWNEAKAIMTYAFRMKIEEMFRDFKSLFKLRQFRVEKYIIPKLEKLLLALILTYILIAIMGKTKRWASTQAFVVRKEHVSVIQFIWWYLYHFPDRRRRLFFKAANYAILSIKQSHHPLTLRCL